MSVVCDAPEPATAGLVADLTEALAQRTRAVCRIPLEASGIHGRRSWTQACAAIATLL